MGLVGIGPTYNDGKIMTKEQYLLRRALKQMIDTAEDADPASALDALMQFQCGFPAPMNVDPFAEGLFVVLRCCKDATIKSDYRSPEDNETTLRLLVDGKEVDS